MMKIKIFWPLSCESTTETSSSFFNSHIFHTKKWKLKNDHHSWRHVSEYEFNNFHEKRKKVKTWVKSMWFENHLKNDHHRHFGTKNSAWLQKHNLEKAKKNLFEETIVEERKKNRGGRDRKKGNRNCLLRSSRSFTPSSSSSLSKQMNI